MTTVETEVRCEHDPAAVCWRCSDQVPWWKEARKRAGLGELPPNKAYWRSGVVEWRDAKR